MRKLLAKLTFLALFLCTVSILHAQDTSSVNGVVQDATGAIVPGVSVVLSNPSTGTRFTTQTNSLGVYRFPNVPPHEGYVLSFTMSGFASYQVKNVTLSVGTPRTQNATLQAGRNEQIEVSAASQAVTINTEDAQVGNNVQVEQLNELPVQVRDNPNALFYLQPGVAGNGSVTGARTDQTNVMVDGLDVNDFATGNFGAIVGTAPIDSLQEFKGTVGGFNPDSGPGGGGQFQLVTKSGTNSWHGDLNEYHRDRSTVANDWFNNNVGTPRVQLIRNQFGGALGGPIKRDKAFFFFDYNASRIAQSVPVERTVPIPSYVAGSVNYINNGAGCTTASRLNTTPNCISTLSPAQVAALDPLHIGDDAAVTSLYKAAYPAPNDPAFGDGVNTEGFRFNAGEPDNESTYVGRLDYNLTSKLKLYGIGEFNRRDAVQTAQQFPSSPILTAPFSDRSYRWSGSAHWEIGGNKVNEFTIGRVVANYLFPVNYNPQGNYPVSFASGTITLMSGPYKSPVNAQGREIPTNEATDEFSWVKGHHSLDFGGTFKWIHTHDFTKLDYSTITIGLGGTLQNLNTTLRPADILVSGSSARPQNTYDSAFAAVLGHIGNVAGDYVYDNTGKPLAQGTGTLREYQYYQPQLWAGDTWKVTPHLTLSFGLNWQYFSVPYEVHGLETIEDTTFDQFISKRIQQSAASASGATSLPFITYMLGGKANNARGLYNPDWKDFAPRFGFNFSPSWDPKMVFRGGAGMVYDRTIVSAVQYQQDQYSYVFLQPLVYNSNNDLSLDPRFGTAAQNAALSSAPPTPKLPYQPYIVNGNPTGLANGQAFNESIDPNLKTPYSIMPTFGIQRDFGNGFILKIDYVGRFGRRLLAQADANQVIEFKDPASGQLLSQAMAAMTLAERAGTNPHDLPAQPFIENQAGPGLAARYGTYAYKCGGKTAMLNWTSFVACEFASGLIQNGDFADYVQLLGAIGLPYNVGMGSQFSENTFYTNKGFSGYNGMLVTLTRNMRQGLRFDVNYTWSHSIDNTSLVANSPALGGYGFVCDVLRPRLCRGNSDFDVTHIITSNFIYQLPFGRGRMFGGNVPWALNEIIGGWDLSGITQWHSGYAWSTVSNAFVAGYANNAPAIFNGNTAALQRGIHKNSGGQLFLFSNPAAAVGSFSGPVGFNIGSRNILRGPMYFDQDLGLAKSFLVWPEKNMNLKFRADAFNAFNHPSFGTPGDNSSYDDITNPGSFGQLTGMAGVGPRVVQLALRLEF